MKRLALAFLIPLAGCGDASFLAPLVPATAVPLLAVAPSLPTFRPPFTGARPLIHPMDHSFPLVSDNNGTMVTYWNESIQTANLPVADGHAGYDWDMPIGTPILAVAGGVVDEAGIQPPFFCQAVDSVVSNQRTVKVLHTLSGGKKVISLYTHLNTIQVSVGAVVSTGTQIGTSGKSGCALNPHLHFQTFREVGGSFRTIDPYGWTSAAPDPWIGHPSGAESIQLWISRPQLFKEKSVPPNPGDTTNALVTVTKTRWMGINDDAIPNNEFVELTLDTRYGSSISLNGFKIRGDVSGFEFAIPAGYTLTTASPVVQIYSGQGTNTATRIYMQRTSPMWSNAFNDCVRRLNPGNVPYNMNLGNGCPST